jgi:hypothetical protein
VVTISCKAQRLLVLLVLGNSGKASGEAKGLVSIEGAHFLGCDRCVWNEESWGYMQEWAPRIE